MIYSHPKNLSERPRRTVPAKILSRKLIRQLLVNILPFTLILLLTAWLALEAGKAIERGKAVNNSQFPSPVTGLN